MAYTFCSCMRMGSIRRPKSACSNIIMYVLYAHGNLFGAVRSLIDPLDEVLEVVRLRAVSRIFSPAPADQPRQFRRAAILVLCDVQQCRPEVRTLSVLHKFTDLCCRKNRPSCEICFVYIRPIPNP